MSFASTSTSRTSFSSSSLQSTSSSSLFPTFTSPTSLSSTFTSSIFSPTSSSSPSVLTTTISDAIVTTITEVGVPTTTGTSNTSSTSHKSHLAPGTIAGLVIGSLLAGAVAGGCIAYIILVVRRRLRLRERKAAVGTNPEERLMHLEQMRGQAAPPLRETFAIQNLPPSKNIRVLNWLARTQVAGPPSTVSVSQHTMSERSHNHSGVQDERYRPVTSTPPPPGMADEVEARSNSTVESRYSQPSVLPHHSGMQRDSATN